MSQLGEFALLAFPQIVEHEEPESFVNKRRSIVGSIKNFILEISKLENCSAIYLISNSRIASLCEALKGALERESERPIKILDFDNSKPGTWEKFQIEERTLVAASLEDYKKSLFFKVLKFYEEKDVYILAVPRVKLRSTSSGMKSDEKFDKIVTMWNRGLDKIGPSDYLLLGPDEVRKILERVGAEVKC